MKGGWFINPNRNQTKEQTLSTTSIPVVVAIAAAKLQLDVAVTKFEGLLTAATLSDSQEKVPRPKEISKLRKKRSRLEERQKEEEESLEKRAWRLSEEYQIKPEEAVQILKAAEVISQELQTKGLLYQEKPFNIGLTAPYPIEQETAINMTKLSTQALQALEELARQKPQIADLLNRGSTELERNLWPKQPGYSLAAPVNRIDIAAGKIIELGPTFADGFATAQVLAETWGFSSKAISILGETFIDLYQEFCLSTGKKTKEAPTIGLIYIRATQDMKDEMSVLARYLKETDKFSTISFGLPNDVIKQQPDIVFFYLKPSMIDGYQGEATPEGEGLVSLYGTTSCLVPPLKEQLGKKAALAIMLSESGFFQDKLGKRAYEQLRSLLAPTEIVTPETCFPRQASVLKPSSGGSCDGVIDTDDPLFPERFEEAQIAFNDPQQDIWVMQPRLAETLPSLWVRNRKGEVIKINQPYVKQTIMVAGETFAGGFATADIKLIIDDGGFSFPCKLKNKK